MASIDSAAAAGSAAAAAAAGGAEDPSQDVYYLTDAQLKKCGVFTPNYTLLPRTKHIHPIDHQMGIFPQDVWAALFPYLGFTALTMRKVSHFFRQEKFQLKDDALNIFRNRYLAIPPSSMPEYFGSVPEGKKVDLREVTYIGASSHAVLNRFFMSSDDKIESDLAELVKLDQIAPHLTSLRGNDLMIQLNKMSENEDLSSGDQFTDFLNAFSHQLPQFMKSFYGRPNNLEYLLLFLDAARHMQSWNIDPSKPIGGLQGEGLDGKLPNLQSLESRFETVEDFIAMMEAAPNLEKLTDLKFESPSKGMLAAALGDKAGRYSSVKESDISCESWSSDDLKAVFEAMPNLKKVELWDGARLNLAAIPASSLQHLEEIAFELTLVRPCDVEALISHAPELKNVKLMYCRLISAADLDRLKTTYPQIAFEAGY